MPYAILANIFLVSHILLLFHSSKGSWNNLQNMRNSEFPILHAAPCDNNYLKNFAIWLGKNIFGNNSRTRILPDMGFVKKVKNQMGFFSALFLGKTNDKISRNCEISYFWAFFHKNWSPSLFSIYSPLPSCKKLEKTNESIQRKILNVRTKE